MLFPWWVVLAAFVVGCNLGVLLMSMLAVAHHADACAAGGREAV